jgi:DNA-binding transcriptional regulator YdaS (Cro superfamily)
MRSNGLARAIAIVGGVAEMARRLSVTSQAVSQWDEVPAERVLQVERACNGEVTRYDLRPDIYPREEGEFSSLSAHAGDKPRARAG